MVNNSFGLLVIILLLLVVLLGFSIFYLYFYNNYNSREKSIEKTFAKEQQASTDCDCSEAQAQEGVDVLLLIIIEQDYTKSSEDGYLEDYEDYMYQDFEDTDDMEYTHYPFRDIDLNVRSINGFETEAPPLNWSLGKVYYIDQDTSGEILWVWVQIHLRVFLYHPTPMPSPLEATQFILQCTLSKDLKSHPISKGYFVLLEYNRRGNEENFLNRTFTIIKIQKD